jgi:TolB protein
VLFRSLSLPGNVELYVMNIASRRLTRLTTTAHASESSPNWSPDGTQLAYVSDAGRSPQVYTMHRDARQGKRVVFGLSESVAPDWGPDGTITFCGRQGGRYGIYTTQAGGAPKLVSPADGTDYEDPSWAPDARHIVCTRTAGRRRSLVILDTMGDAPVQLVSVEGDWYLADWSK